MKKEELRKLRATRQVRKRQPAEPARLAPEVYEVRKTQLSAEPAGLLVALGPAIWGEVCQAGIGCVYRRDETILQQEQAVAGVHVIVEGRVGLYRRRAEVGTKQVLLLVKGAGDVFDLAAWVNGGPAAATAVAATDVETRFLDRATARRLLLERSEAVPLLLEGISADLRRTMEIIRSLCFQTVPERLAEALLRHDVSGSIRYVVRDLAAAVGTSREVVSRHLHRFERDGVVSLQGQGEMRILLPEALRRVAGGSDR